MAVVILYLLGTASGLIRPDFVAHVALRSTPCAGTQFDPLLISHFCALFQCSQLTIRGCYL